VAGSPTYVITGMGARAAQDEAMRRANEISGKKVGGMLKPGVSNFTFGDPVVVGGR
jgi:hypothetical protein